MSQVQKLATQQAWEERKEQGLPTRMHVRTPVLVSMKLRLRDPIDERQYLAGRDAQTAYLARQGLSVRVYDRVDCGNGTEASAAHRMDGGKLWFGMEGAVVARAGVKAKLCLTSICDDDEFPFLARRCGFTRIQYGRERAHSEPALALVHRTLHAVADYLDECGIGGMKRES